jgi:hypothetical protein
MDVIFFSKRKDFDTQNAAAAELCWLWCLFHVCVKLTTLFTGRREIGSKKIDGPVINNFGRCTIVHCISRMLSFASCNTGLLVQLPLMFLLCDGSVSTAYLLNQLLPLFQTVHNSLKSFRFLPFFYDRALILFGECGSQFWCNTFF